MNTKTASWIWYPGDFEIWLGNIFNNRRTERGAMFPPFWKQDSHYPMVEFQNKYDVPAGGCKVSLHVEGTYNVAIDGQKLFGMPTEFTIPAGEHTVSIKVVNQATPPAIYLTSEDGTVVSDGTWTVTYEDKIWIDENGVAHGSGIYVPAGVWNFTDPCCPPSQFRLATEERQSTLVADTFNLYDFGKETMGYLILEDIKSSGTISIYYGESKEEALDKEHCETLDIIRTEERDRILLQQSRAFRYVFIECEEDVSIGKVSMLYEYLPEEYRGSFRCNDEEVNRIWDVAAYTMHLTTREFFMDGIKRDRWTWSGDAIQSYLMNYYLFFDSECVKRTIRQLRGKDPVTAHVNTIMDYTFYWFRSIYDYYLYTGDERFVLEMYPKMVTLMDYCLSRTDDNLLMAGQADDWIFVDWVDFPMPKRGVMCFEQILFCMALQTMAICARICDRVYDSMHYEHLAGMVKDAFMDKFWDKDRHAFLHNESDGTICDMITKFPNMFAILYDMVDEQKKHDIMQHVMLSNDVEAITTPYMRFYELEALCMNGMQTDVMKEIKAYWGGMLKEGATSFWEKYIPTEKGTEHLAMYGRPYGKSLCHAWGASPIYLLGKYFLGVRPVSPGYEEYEVEPHLGGLQWMKGAVPTPFGEIHVEASTTTEGNTEYHVKSNGGKGTLIIGKEKIDIPANKEVVFSSGEG